MPYVSDRITKEQKEVRDAPIRKAYAAISDWELGRRKLLTDTMQYNPAATNYAIDATYGNVGNLTNTPNTLIVSAHGDKEFPGYRFDKSNPGYRQASQNEAFRDIVSSQEANPGVGIKHDINKDYGDFNIQEVAQILGVRTNDIKHFINSSCYGGDCRTFGDAQKVFPNLQSFVSSDPKKKTSAAEFEVLSGERPGTPDEIWGLKNNTVGPMYEYTSQSTNQVKNMLDWIRTNTVSQRNLTK